MAVAATFRFKLADAESARKQGKIANDVWKKAGATSARVYTVMVGPNVGNWIFAIEFADLATFEKARTKVRASPEYKKWTAVNAKVGNTVIDAGLLEEIAL